MAERSPLSRGSRQSWKSPKVRRSRAEWVEFLRNEKQKVKDGLGLTDNGLILKEVCRRWALIKTQGASSAPLLLEDGEGAKHHGRSGFDHLRGAARDDVDDVLRVGAQCAEAVQRGGRRRERVGEEVVVRRVLLDAEPLVGLHAAAREVHLMPNHWYLHRPHPHRNMDRRSEGAERKDRQKGHKWPSQIVADAAAERAAVVPERGPPETNCAPRRRVK